MNLPFNSFLFTFILIYTLATFYVGWRGWELLNLITGQKYRKQYWLGLILFSAAYFLGRAGESYLPEPFSNWLILAGSYWLGLLYYGVLLLLAVDVIRLLDRWLHFTPALIRQHPAAAGSIIAVLLVGIVVYGSWNAKHPRVHHYELTIPKQAALTQLHIVMVSDIHLGQIINNSRLQSLVQQIQGLNPDIIMLAGDIVDGDLEPFISQDMPAALRQLHAPYGVYAVLGNHDYHRGRPEAVAEALSSAGVHVLRDQVVKVADSFYLAGREDRTVERRVAGSRRLSLEQLLANTNPAVPLILLDHQPYRLDASQANGVDLQLSGHTHYGQLFPNHLITGMIFEEDWGHLQKGNSHFIVSSGYGTWGPPLRTGNTPEIVDIVIHFAN